MFQNHVEERNDAKYPAEIRNVSQAVNPLSPFSGPVTLPAPAVPVMKPAAPSPGENPCLSPCCSTLPPSPAHPSWSLQGATKKTRIPFSHQRRFHLRVDVPVDSVLRCRCRTHVSCGCDSHALRVPLFAEEIAGCDICGKEDVLLRCDACDAKVLCRGCDATWHKHPKRSTHQRTAASTY